MSSFLFIFFNFFLLGGGWFWKDHIYGFYMFKMMTYARNSAGFLWLFQWSSDRMKIWGGGIKVDANVWSLSHWTTSPWKPIVHCLGLGILHIIYIYVCIYIYKMTPWKRRGFPWGFVFLLGENYITMFTIWVMIWTSILYTQITSTQEQGCSRKPNSFFAPEGLMVGSWKFQSFVFVGAILRPDFQVLLLLVDFGERSFWGA